MMMNLFSIFDPSTNFFYIPNWVSMCLPIFYLSVSYWWCPNRDCILWDGLFLLLRFDLKSVLKKYNNFILVIFLSLFSFIILNNLLGLLPYVFTATSHLMVSIVFALPFWLSFMFFGWTNTPKLMFAHLVPKNSDLALSFFLVVIETISNLIRPLTLSVRLTANMLAGHMILSLLSSLVVYLPVTFPGFVWILSCLLILETMVAIIQGYVFILLLSLFLSEIA